MERGLKRLMASTLNIFLVCLYKYTQKYLFILVKEGRNDTIHIKNRRINIDFLGDK